MSPNAWDLMQEEDPMTFADISDMAVAVTVVAGAIFLAGYSLATYHHETRRQECPAEINGRPLTAYHLGERGAERCVYAAPMKKL